MEKAQTAVTAPAGVAAHYESSERDDEMKGGMEVACRKKNQGSGFAG